MDFYQKDSTGTKTTSENSVSRKPLFGFQDKEEELGIRGDTEKKAIQYSMLCVWDKKH